MQQKNHFTYLLYLSITFIFFFNGIRSIAQRNITFVVVSDLHYGVLGCDIANKKTIEFINKLPGTDYPDSIGGKISVPRGIIIPGDLTEDGKKNEWEMFVNDWGIHGENKMKFPVYEGYGNHDAGIADPVLQGIIDRNKIRKGLSAVGKNGINYSWDWDDIHFVMLNIFPSIDYSGGSLKFLKSDLAKRVGMSGRPVVLIAHYGFDPISLKYWSADERENFYNIIKDYNILAYFHGHSHKTEYTKWKSIDTYADGSVKFLKPNAGQCLVVNIKDGEMTILSRMLSGWKKGWEKKIEYDGYFLSPDFYSDKMKICKNNTIQFTDKTVGVVDSYKWTFEGGTPENSFEKNPLINYMEPGTFDVVIEVYNKGGSNTKRINDYIKVIDYLPNAKFELDRKKINQGENILFKSLSGNTPLLWEWLFEEGNPSQSSDENPIITYNKPGSFLVSLTVENECGRDIERIDKAVQVKAVIPEANFSSNTVTVGCLYEEVQFRSESSGDPYEYSWIFEGGKPASSSSAEPVVSYRSPGEYDVVLTVTNQSGSHKTMKKDYISVGQGKDLPLIEDFEGVFPPDGWKIVNPDYSVTWQKGADTGMDSESSLIINNANNGVGEIDEIILPALNFSKVSSSILSFDVAYTRYDDKKSDNLKVFISKDCGSNWEEVYNKKLIELETKILESYIQSSYWIPFHKENWKHEVIDLGIYMGYPNVIVKFQNISGFGTKIWIDNVKVARIEN